MKSRTQATTADLESVNISLDETKTAPSLAIDKPYEPTPHEEKALGAFRARSKGNKPAPQIKVANGKGMATLALDHPDPEIGQFLLMEALGTADPYFLDRKAALILQHYGVATGMLDITRSQEVALYFAQYDGEGRSTQNAQPVVYAFFLDRARDPYLNGAQLYDRLGALRPARQQCGAMLGATMITSNTYARYIYAEIHLEAPIAPEGIDREFLFPTREQDRVLHLVGSQRCASRCHEGMTARVIITAPTDADMADILVTSQP